MGVEITMPQLSDTMSEGTILTWLKKEGDKVKRGDSLAEVETDKANLEIEAFQEGILERIVVPAGVPVEVGKVIAVISKPSQVAESTSAATPVSHQEHASAQTSNRAVSSQSTSSTDFGAQKPDTNVSSVQAIRPVVSQQVEERLKISPLARNIALSHGVEMEALVGTGEGGRIIRRDVEKLIGSSASPERSAQTVSSVIEDQTQAEVIHPTFSSRETRELENLEVGKPILQPVPRPAEPNLGLQKMSKMRATIAERMVQSATTIPHFYTTSKVSVDELKRVRTTLKTLPQYEGLTYNHFILKAVGQALRLCPRINSAYQDGGIFQPQSVNIGIVTAVNDGLLIPVVKEVQDLTLADIVSEARGLVQRARSGKPKPTDLVGGTFSVSNMGQFAVENFTAIISPGQGAILAVSAIQEEAVVVDGSLRVGSVMRLTLSVDHRIVDGVTCGEFMTELKKLLEDPILLLA